MAHVDQLIERSIQVGPLGSGRVAVLVSGALQLISEQELGCECEFESECLCVCVCSNEQI